MHRIKQTQPARVRFITECRTLGFLWACCVRQRPLRHLAGSIRRIGSLHLHALQMRKGCNFHLPLSGFALCGFALCYLSVAIIKLRPLSSKSFLQSYGYESKRRNMTARTRIPVWMLLCFISDHNCRVATWILFVQCLPFLGTLPPGTHPLTTLPRNGSRIQ